MMKTNPFYLSKEWRRVRKEILQADKHECQKCKERGYYTRANHVHHVKHLEQYPSLALEKHYTDDQGEHRQLISLCHPCHMEEHSYQYGGKEPLTEERW